jgi:hypothetical protein
MFVSCKCLRRFLKWLCGSSVLINILKSNFLLLFYLCVLIMSVVQFMVVNNDL